MRCLIEKNRIYKFDELSEDAKQVVINYEKNDYCEFCLEEIMKDEAKSLINIYFKHATLDNVYYDLNYSQGSGAMIELHYNNLDEFLADNECLREKINLTQTQIDRAYFELNIKHNNRCYYHENSFDSDCYIELPDDVDNAENIEDIIYSYIEELFAYNDSKYYNMNNEFTKIGYKLIENDNYFIENIDNCYYFETGEFACFENDRNIEET